MKKASWIFLGLVGVLLALGSLISMSVAYLQPPSNDIVVSASIAQLAAGDEAVETALRGRRGTAAGFAFAFAALYLMVVVGPYRRGDVWAWWALLVSVLALTASVLLRIPTLGTTLGVATPVALLIGTLIGLLLDVKRLLKK